jgi:Protein of unknown function (DUF1861)
VSDRFSVDDLLRVETDADGHREGTIVRLEGRDGLDGYNPSGPVSLGGSRHVYVRLEPRGDEFSSWAVPFRQLSDEDWVIDRDLLTLRAQDPAVATVGNEIVVSGVQIVARRHDYVYFRTVFWRGTSFADLSEFAAGPAQMKDIRLVGLEDGRIGIFSRPMGSVGGRGKVGYTEVEGIDQLTSAAIAGARLIEPQPVDDHWWGVNDVYDLGAGLLGILGHVAKFGPGWERHYYGFAGIFDRREHRLIHGPKIIAKRSMFPDSAAKRPDLVDVVFPTWIDREKGLLFAGISDVAVGVTPIRDPFAAAAGIS